MTRTSLSDAVFDALRAQILGGELEPGALLPGERELCAAFNVNRGALREALKRLSQLGLVQVRQGGATRVRDFQSDGGLELLPALLVGPDPGLRRDAVRGLFELRSAIGPDIARLAAERRSEEDLEVLDGLVAQLAQLAEDTDARALQRTSMALWERLALASGNLAYRLVYNSMRGTWAPAQDAAAAALLPELSDTKRYRKLAAAVRKQNGAQAQKHARALLDAGFAGLRDFLSLDEET